MIRIIHRTNRGYGVLDLLTRLPLLIFILCTFLGTLDNAQGLHLTGTFQNKDFFLFLAKFGFQKVDDNNVGSTTGYIYGKIKARNYNVSINHDMYLVVVDSQYFVQYYAQRNKDLPAKCSVMFSKIDTIAWDQYCTPHGQEDFLRRIPCPDGKLCSEELGEPSAVQDGQQFTYHIVDPNQPRFWYVSMVACHRPRANKKKLCKWSYNSSLDLTVDYDIWFVNGDPASKHLNPFEHQFSYELHDVLEIYLAFLILNGLLLIVQIWACRNQRHLLLRLLTAVLVMEVTGIFFNLVNISVFALDGKGVPALRVLGNFVDMCAQCTMMLELLYIAKGWTITFSVLNHKVLLYTTWSLYSAVYVVLFVFTQIAVDPIGDLDEWQTTPGYCILVFRMILMLYFLYELQNTFAQEANDTKRNFYTRFGAGFLAWFIYLPIAALVSPKIAALWRFKTLLSIQSGADLAFLAILVHLFWPSGGNAYFNIPRKVQKPSNGAMDVTALISEEDEESSEDELYERQASIRLNSIPFDDHISNGALNKPPLSAPTAEDKVASVIQTAALHS